MAKKAKIDEALENEAIVNANEQAVEGNVNEVEEADVDGAEEAEFGDALDAPIDVEVKEATVVSTVRTVLFRATENINVTIGGKDYHIRADQEVKVPVDVACILSNSRKGFRV